MYWKLCLSNGEFQIKIKLILMDNLVAGIIIIMATYCYQVLYLFLLFYYIIIMAMITIMIMVIIKGVPRIKWLML